MTQTSKQQQTSDTLASLRSQAENSANPPKGWSKMTKTELRENLSKEDK